MKSRILAFTFVSCLFALSFTAQVSRAAQPSLRLADASAESGDATIPSAALLQPEQLMKILQSPAKPLVLQVGSHVLYAEAHIRGSEYAGEGGSDDGLQALRQRVSTLKKSQPIVLYCGCCPWSRCPNIRPAFALLHQAGFTDVKALYIAQDFGTNWVAKGYPTTKGR